MKNTVKKILALVFVVAMVCSLAVPAFAADPIKVTVTVIDYSGKAIPVSVELTNTAPTVEDAIEAANKNAALASAQVVIKSSTGKVSKVGTVEVDEDVNDIFGTASWTVALNGKVQNVDLDTVAVAKKDKIVVYWADTTFGTKLAQVDASAIDQGIISFYYYDVEGNKQPLKSANVTLKDANDAVVYDRLNRISSETNANGDYVDAAYSATFKTDEKGQIWLAPEYLDNAAKYTVTSLSISALKAVTKDQGYTEDEVTFYNKNLTRNLEDGAAVGYVVTVDGDMYDVAGATGDMTIVYALVAAAAVITLAAVVVMKKKSVKAN